MSNFDVLKEVLVEKLGVDEAKITENASLVEDLGADSLDAVEVVMELENRLSIEIPDSEAQGLAKVSDILKVLDEKVAK